MKDVMKQLRAADPARRAGLDAVEPAAFAALREEIIMTGTQLDAAEADRATAGVRDLPGIRRRRFGPRAAVATGLATALVGGGVAFAVVQGLAREAAGLTCMTTWDDSALDGLDLDATGPWLTGDAVADCTTMLAEAGLPPVQNPVVFEHDGQVYVTPLDQAPGWIKPVDSAAGPVIEPELLEVRLSTGDLVDGGNSTCRSVDEGVAWAQSELDRLGLDDWTVEVVGTPTAERPCTTISAEVEGIVSVSPEEDPGALYGSAEVDPVVAALRSDIADGCVTAEQARAAADQALASLEHWPTTTVLDESAECARVDLEVLGSIQVTVYGPTTVG